MRSKGLIGKYRRWFASIIAFALVCTTIVGTAPPAKAEEAGAGIELRFDFGTATSPVQSGALQVHESLLYTADRGYGLDRIIASRNRSGGDDWTNDFVLGVEYTFMADVPNGEYDITAYSGDLLEGTSSTRTNITLEGAAAGSISSRQAVTQATFRTTVQDGQLTVGVTGSGVGGYLNGLIVKTAVPTPPPAPASLVVAGMTVAGEPSVTLQWSTVTEAVYYQLYRSASDAVPPAPVARTSELSYTDQDVVEGGTYTYRVSAVSASGLESEPSAPVTATLTQTSGPAEPLPEALPLRFDFGPGAVEEGYFAVRGETAYNAELKYGFANPSMVSSADRATPDALRADFVSPAGTPFLLDLPAGDYKITVVAGDAEATTNIGVKAESITKIPVVDRAAGQYLEQSFDLALVDGQLTLELLGTSPKLNALVIEKLPERSPGERPTVYLAGDSTVQTYDEYWKPEAGWGQMIPRYFTNDVAFDNRAIGGRSSKSFQFEGRLDAILLDARPGDYLMVQFGHNDATVSVPERYASVPDYKNYLKTYVAGARQRGATPILVTPVGRRDFNPETGKFNVSFPDYVAGMKEVAQELNVPLVDLSALSVAYYNEIGPEATMAVFLYTEPGMYPAFPNGSQDNTHFQEYGAIQIARLVSVGVKALSGVPLSNYVTDVEPPAAVPAKPTGLVASNVSNAGATLAWNAVEGADIYKIYRKRAADEAYALIGTSTVPTLSVIGMTEGETYHLRVSAVNGKGESEPSDAVVVRMKQATIKFDFGLANSPVAAGYTGVNLSTVYSQERGYGIVNPQGMIGRDRGTGGDLLRDWLGYFNVGWQFDVDVPNGLYSVKVYVGDYSGSARTTVAVEGQDYGQVSAPRNNIAEKIIPTVSVKDGRMNFRFAGSTGIVNGLEITPILAAPANLRIDSLDLDPEQPSATLLWDPVDDAAQYRVYKRIEGAKQAELAGVTSATSFSDTAMDVGLQYEYSVSTVDHAGTETVPSSPLLVPMFDPSQPVPAVPSNLRLGAVNKNDLTIEWDSADGAYSYVVYRAKKADGPYALVGRTKEPRFTDTTVLTTIRYYYKVASAGLGGKSGFSEPIETPAVTVLKRQMETLDRAPVAIATEQGVYIGWRKLGLDPANIAFALYRDGKKITGEPIEGATNWLDREGTAASVYQLYTVVDGVETPATQRFGVWQKQYLSVPLDKPADGVTKDNQPYTYHAGDASVGDLDGDGTYEIVLLWNPSNAKDNSQAGYTGIVYMDAYKLDGTRLWRINLGPNIRAGAHYTQFMVYDLDGDGKSEVAFKTADGTVDGVGNVIGRAGVDHRNSSGYVLQGAEYITVFEGATGKALATAEYDPPRGDVSSWGDSYGNRVDRFLAAVAYLDGERPSLVMSRGYYTRTVLAAYNYRDGQLTKLWRFDTNDEGNGGYAGQGNHNLSIGDVDGDGKDEISFGAMAIDDDGTGLYTTGLGHGDAMHLGDLDPDRPGLELFDVHEHADSPYGMEMRDPATGEVLWGVRTGVDTGRGMTADIDPRHLGEEAWSATITNEQQVQITGLYNVKGERISLNIPTSTNFGIWWDGDLLRELLDGIRIDKWDYESETTQNVLTATGSASNNSTKANPSLQADLFGDWREEVVWRAADSSELRIYSTTDVTEHGLRTLMHDPIYRLGVAWQNVGYNQPPHTGYYLGVGMTEPAAPSIYLTAANLPDIEPPTIVFQSADGATYGVADLVPLGCETTDAQSGIVSSDCDPNAAAFGYELGGGTHVLTAHATDAAGNAAQASITIHVAVDFEGVIALTRSFVSSADVESSLIEKLQAAQAADARGNGQAKEGQLGAYMNQLKAQTDKAIAPEQASVLAELARQL
ncbi:fibronectin type III domain-containing protein [Paenibacillus sp.]|uniref:rhamnogalacturonan lyase family protein n=1 Tax=Paenibacillus sp. TaxID=58172 RepID=UPI002D2B2D65|nr:SGNH/GDSL hydrolase family protein [Paenibacillus sp.]HZG86618.1 SGNH/GDSL hydrolase family protein [Paenibacillus sp.]